MRGPAAMEQMETVVVAVRGKVLDSVSFQGRAAAETYKRNVRRWAFEKGIVVTLWSGRQAAPVPERWETARGTALAC